MSNEQQSQPSAAGTQGEPGEPTQGEPGEPTSQAQPSEDELRAAYEAELNRITSAEMIIQTTVSLINIGGRRLGLAPAGAGGDPSAAPGSERDLEQVRDAIDGASALMPILERRMPAELGPLRDAIAATASGLRSRGTEFRKHDVDLVGIAGQGCEGAGEARRG